MPVKKSIMSTLKYPNIVFICSDQHSGKYTGFMGHPFVKTPNLDRIAQQGVVFTNTYSNQPVCVPGRSALMTGMFASDCGSYCNSTIWNGSHPTWGFRLQQAGYYTRAHGKMDLNDRFDVGFEEIETNHGHQHNPDITSLFRRPVCYRVGERPQVDGKTRQERMTADARVTELALDFLSNPQGSQGKPWALYLGYLEPHPPFKALPEYFEKYYPNRVDMPNIPPEHLENLHPVFQKLRQFKRIATPVPEERIRRARAAYFGMISELDEYIGQVWQALEKQNLLQNTIFIYTSDHGEMLGEHGLWYKNNLLESSVRVPLVIAGPGIPRGVIIDTPVSHVDLVKTLLEWTGIKNTPELRGYSLTGLMKNEVESHPGSVYSETHSEGNCSGSFMIRKGDWKYIHFTWYDDLLFNRKDDPFEFENRIDDPTVGKIKEELNNILQQLVRPEEITIAAFKAQEQILKDWTDHLGEEELFQKFKSRLGEGQARAIAKKLKGV